MEFPKEYNAWIKYIKKLNLSLKELSNIINDGDKCDFHIYIQLPGEMSVKKAELLLKRFSEEKITESSFTDMQLLEINKIIDERLENLM